MRHFAGWILIVFSIVLFCFMGDIAPLLSRVAYQNASQRQITYLCQMLLLKQVSESELCSLPVVAIPSLAAHYARIREQDEEWYRLKGANYYPEVICFEPSSTAGEHIFFDFMGRRYTCNEKGESVYVAR